MGTIRNDYWKLSVGDASVLEGDIGTLETSYYETIGKLNDMDPYAIGFVSPRVVGYVVEAQGTGLTRAD